MSSKAEIDFLYFIERLILFSFDTFSKGYTLSKYRSLFDDYLRY